MSDLSPAVPSGRAPVSSFARNLSAPMSLRQVDDQSRLDGHGVARGGGCSYGDQSLVSGGVGWRAPGHVATHGDVVVAGGSAALRDVLGVLWPRGRNLPVLPGALSVTVGGAIAADVHGKNHVHAGSFGDHVDEVTLVTPTGTHVLGADTEAFRATVGGMGLTGVVVQARLRTVPLRSGWARHRVQRVRGASELLEALSTSSREHEHAATWIDLLAPEVRGVVEASDTGATPPSGEPDLPVPRSARLTMPFVPGRLVRGVTMRLFNEARWRTTGDGASIVPLATALVPLDVVDGFPRAYGPAGLVQHQVFVPEGHEELLLDLLERHRSAPVVPALAVLKRLGSTGPGHLSFPGSGWTLAVDHPADTPALADLFDAMDRDVASAGGRVYLAKDATMRPSVVGEMYPALDDWRSVAAGLDPHHLVTSDLDRRLGLREPFDGGTGAPGGDADA